MQQTTKNQIKRIAKIQETFGIYSAHSAVEVINEDFISIHDWTSINKVDGDLVNKSDLFVSDDSDNWHVYQFVGDEPILIGTWLGDDEFSGDTAMSKWIKNNK